MRGLRKGILNGIMCVFILHLCFWASIGILTIPFKGYSLGDIMMLTELFFFIFVILINLIVARYE